jgi:eukaryotic-like serine/threonine-protein kinase
VYDDADDQFYQGYPSQVRRRPTIVASILTSAVTTIVLFFALRELDQRGYLGGARAGRERAAATSSPTAGAVQVPNVVGVRLEQARELLKARGLLISIGEERDDPARPAGSILAQNPLASSETQPGTTVQVVVARTATAVIVPPLAGLKPEEAVRQLTAKGLQLGPQKMAASEAVAPGLVAGSEPAAGSAAAPGSAVSLLIAAPAGKPVPKVTGKRLATAKRLLEEAGFKVGKTVYRYDPCCGEYIILRQTPAEGEAAAPGATVDLVVNEPG